MDALFCSGASPRNSHGEYVVLQQPESLEVAENYAKLKESVLATSGKKEEFSPKEVSAQILEELSKAIGSKDMSPAVSAINQREPFVSKSRLCLVEK